MFSLSRTLNLSWLYKQSSKLTITLIIFLTICHFSLPLQAKYGGGAGVENDPYLIYTAEQFNEIGANPGDWNKHFKLMEDIDLSEYTDGDFNIIGTDDRQSFEGVFNGNDLTISNLSLNLTRQQYTGLFGCVGGQIRDLGLIDPDISVEGRAVGSLVGYLYEGSIIGCYVEGANVSGISTVGGLVGLNSGRIFNSYSRGYVFGNEYVGGLIGLVSDGTVTQCFSKASVTGNENVGGLVALTTKESSIVTDCYATGSVEGTRYVGGLAGQVSRGTVYKCYSAGSVSGNRDVGGLSGYMRALGGILLSFWDIQTSGQLTSAGGTGLPTEQMQIISTYTDAGWGFRITWTICDGMNYPVLQWQIPAADFLCPDGVDFIDFCIFAEHWLEDNCNEINSYCQGTDFDESGLVDFRDLEIFADSWLTNLP